MKIWICDGNTGATFVDSWILNPYNFQIEIGSPEKTYALQKVPDTNYSYRLQPQLWLLGTEHSQKKDKRKKNQAG
jgi:hypothetical protein